MTAINNCTIDQIAWCNFPAYSIANSLISAVIVPCLGGKIASLVDLGSGRQWMFTNPSPSPAVPEYGETYIRHMGGWDECFPSIAQTKYPCAPWQDVVVPDHGEIWSLPWDAKVSADSELIEITTSVEGVRLPYKFSRVIEMTASLPVLSFRYLVENNSDSPMPFIWSSHPTLSASPGDRLILPLQDMTLYHSLADRFGKRGARLTWPETEDRDGQVWDFSLLPKGEPPSSLKLFSVKNKADYAILEDPILGAQLRFEFSFNEITHLGVWLNMDAWAVIEGGPTCYCIAIEPCIGGTDDLALAYDTNEYSIIPARGSRSWDLRVHLEPSKSIKD